jgi:hypothetical protein
MHQLKLEDGTTVGLSAARRDRTWFVALDSTAGAQPRHHEPIA